MGNSLESITDVSVETVKGIIVLAFVIGLGRIAIALLELVLSLA